MTKERRIRRPRKLCTGFYSLHGGFCLLYISILDFLHGGSLYLYIPVAWIIIQGSVHFWGCGVAPVARI